MTIFHQAVEDIFKLKDFLETVLIEGVYYECACTAVDASLVYAESGLELSTPFKLTLKLPLQKMPKIGDKLLFRCQHFKITNVEIDSAGTTVSLSLQSLSKK